MRIEGALGNTFHSKSAANLSTRFLNSGNHFLFAAISKLRQSFLSQQNLFSPCTSQSSHAKIQCNDCDHYHYWHLPTHYCHDASSFHH